MDIKKQLKEEVSEEIQNLKGIELGSEQYKTTVDGVTKLIDRSIELEKLDAENTRQAETRNEEKKDRLIKYGLQVGSIVLPIAVTIWGTLTTLKFEETGTITTASGRQFINNLFRK